MKKQLIAEMVIAELGDGMMADTDICEFYSRYNISLLSTMLIFTQLFSLNNIIKTRGDNSVKRVL